MITRTNAEGSVYQYSYDQIGNRITETDPAGKQILYNYDDLGNLIRRINQVGGQKVYTFDSVGNQLTETDETGRTWTREYDAVNRRIKIIQPSGSQFIFHYDKNGNLIHEQRPNGVIIDYEYDVENQLISQSSGQSTSIIITRNTNGNEIKRGSGEPGTIKNIRNARQEVIKEISYTGLSVDTVNYTYYPEGNINTMISKDDTVIMEWNGIGKQTKQIYNGSTITFQYNAKGLRTQVNYPDFTLTKYQYNAIDQEGLSLTKTLSGDTLQATQRSYNLEGSADSVIYEDGSFSSFKFDSIFNVTQEIHRDSYGNQDTTTYTYFANSIPQTRTNNKTGYPKILTEFSYNTDKYLSQKTETDLTTPGSLPVVTTYVNDSLGNRLHEIMGTDTAMSYAYSYDRNLLKLIRNPYSAEAISHYYDGKIMNWSSSGSNKTRVYFNNSISYKVYSRDRKSSDSAHMLTVLPFQTTFPGPNSFKLNTHKDDMGNDILQTTAFGPIPQILGMNRYNIMGEATTMGYWQAGYNWGGGMWSNGANAYVSNFHPEVYQPRSLAGLNVPFTFTGTTVATFNLLEKYSKIPRTRSFGRVENSFIVAGDAASAGWIFDEAPGGNGVQKGSGESAAKNKPKDMTEEKSPGNMYDQAKPAASGGVVLHIEKLVSGAKGHWGFSVTKKNGKLATIWFDTEEKPDLNFCDWIKVKKSHTSKSSSAYYVDDYEETDPPKEEPPEPPSQPVNPNPPTKAEPPKVEPPKIQPPPDPAPPPPPPPPLPPPPPPLPNPPTEEEKLEAYLVKRNKKLAPYADCGAGEALAQVLMNAGAAAAGVFGLGPTIGYIIAQGIACGKSKEEILAEAAKELAKSKGMDKLPDGEAKDLAENLDKAISDYLDKKEKIDGNK